jgi:putative transposase
MIKRASADFSLSETAYRYQPKRSDENAGVVDLLVRLTSNQRN